MGTPNNGINGTLATGLIGHWDFTDGRLTDVSGNGRDLTMIGTVGNAPDKDGNPNNSKLYNRAGKLTTKYLGTPQDISVSLWVKIPTGLSQVNYALTIGGKGGYQEGYSIAFGYNGNVIIYSSFMNGIYGDIASPTLGLADNSWHHVVITRTRNNGVTRVYVDATLVWQNSGQISDIKYLTNVIEVGGISSFQFFEGSIDEVRIYDRVLETGEVAEIYEMGANYIAPPITPAIPATPNEGINGTLCTDLLAHWSFDNNLLDSSGAERHLTNTGTQVSFVADKDSPCVSVPMGAILTSPIMPNTNATGFTITIWFKHDPLYGRPIFKIRMFSDVEGTDMVDVQYVNTSMQDSGTQRIIMNLSRTIGDAIEGWNCLIVRTSGNGAPFGDVYLNDVLIQAVGFEDNIWNSIQLVIEKNIGEQNDLTDEIRVVGRVLTDAECHEVYTMGVNYTPPIMPPATPNNGISGTLSTGLLAHWDFTNGRLTDVSGNGNDLQSYNFVRSVDDDADGNYADAIKCNGSGYLYLDFEWINNYPGFTISMMFKDNEDTGVYPSALMTICNDLFDDNPPNFSARIGEGGLFQTYTPKYDGWANYMTELPEAPLWGMMIVEIYKKADGFNYAKINITSRYGNGMIVDGEIPITRASQNTAKLIFGATKTPGESVSYSGASIDEIRFYDKLLTSEQKAEIFEMGANYQEEIIPPATPNEGINGTLNNNLLAHWDFFQERLIDVSGNGHVLVRDVSATTPIETRKNMEGTEENDFSIICKKDANLLSHVIDSSVITSGSNKEFSISFWFKKHISTTSLENMLSIGGGTWYGLSFLLENYAPRISIGLLGGEVLHLTNTLYALSNLDFDFHNISMICTTENINKRVAVFLDGVLIINAVIPTEINWSTDPLKVGNSMNVLPQHTDVTIDEIRIYNRALNTGLNLATASIGDEASSEIGEIFTMKQYYLQKCSNPISSMPENIYHAPISIYLNCDTVGAEIRYTLDGSDVDINSTLYTGEIAIENNTELKIMAFKPGLAPSDQVTYFYAIEASNNQKNLTQSNHKFVNITSGVFRITTLGLSTNGDVNIFSLDLTIADAISLNLQNLLEGATDTEKIFNKYGSFAGETYVRKNIVERELKFSLKDDLMLITDEQKDLDTSSNRNILMAMLDGGTFKIDGVQYNVIGINGNEKTITYNNKIFETLFHIDKIISLPDITIEHDSKFFNGTIKNPRLHLYKNNSLSMAELLIEYDETTKEGLRIANSCLSNIAFTEDNSCNKFDITEKQISDIKSISEFFINDMNYINTLFSYNLGNRTLFYSKINDSVINNTTLEINETDLNLATHSIVSYNTILPRSSNIDDIVVCFLNTSKKFVIAKKNGTDTWKLLKNNIFEIEQYSDTYENAIYNIYNFDIVEEKFIKR